MALRSLNHADLGRLIKRQARTISNWCSGSTQPTADDIAACSDALEVSADYLIGRVDDPSGLTPGMWILDVDLIAKARTSPREDVRPGFQVPQRPIILSNEKAAKLLDEITKQRKKGKSDGTT